MKTILSLMILCFALSQPVMAKPNKPEALAKKESVFTKFFKSGLFAKKGNGEKPNPSGWHKGEKKGWGGKDQPPGWHKGEKKGWGDKDKPPGWHNGEKKGWRDIDQPPGQAKKKHGKKAKQGKQHKKDKHERRKGKHDDDENKHKVLYEDLLDL